MRDRATQTSDSNKKRDRLIHRGYNYTYSLERILSLEIEYKMWDVEVTDAFSAWWQTLTED